jgi:hypothetical protein
MAEGFIETLTTGSRAKLSAGIDPSTKKQTYLSGPVRPQLADAVQDRARMPAEPRHVISARAGNRVEWTVSRRTVGRLRSA